MGVVYFARRASGGPVKIGFSTQPAIRLEELRAQHGADLDFVATLRGTRAEEAWLHRYFRPQWVEGEWFAPNDELWAVAFGEAWPGLEPLVLDITSAAPDPNAVDMPAFLWERRADIERFHEAGIREPVIAGLVGLDQSALQLEMRRMLKLGYFRGVRLRGRYAPRARGVAEKYQHFEDVPGSHQGVRDTMVTGPLA